MGTHRICAALAGAVSLTATAALATQEPSKVVLRATPTEPTVVAPLVVEATKPEELKRQTYSFVQTFAATTVKLDQVARWAEPVCVAVQGLPLDADAEVKARVEEVATALKVGLKKDGCKPTIQIFFTDQPQAFMDRVAAQHELLLGYWHHTDREKLKTVTRPIEARYVTGTGGAGGNTIGMTFEVIEQWGIPNSAGAKTAGTAVPVGAAGRQPHGYQYDDEDNFRGVTGCGDKAKFTACLTSEFAHVLVVVDTNKAQDYSPGLIADYVVMVALAQPRSLDGCNVLPSVIDLFSKGCPNFGMEGLTRADVAYLTSLYKIDLEARKGGQETAIAEKMADMLLKANATDRLATFGGAALKTSTGK
jgi:hypothetical protein